MSAWRSFLDPRGTQFWSFLNEIHFSVFLFCCLDYLERAVDTVERCSTLLSNVMLMSCFLILGGGADFPVFGSPYAFSRQSILVFRIPTVSLT